jgi:hypothetical protein
MVKNNNYKLQNLIIFNSIKIHFLKIECILKFKLKIYIRNNHLRKFEEFKSSLKKFVEKCKI